MKNISNNYPEWNATGTEPDQTKKDNGWQPGEKPPADWFNWKDNKGYQSFQDIDAGIATRLSDVLTEGVLTGGEVTENTTADLNVLVEPLTGFNTNGARINLESQQTVDLSSYLPTTAGNEKYVSVYVDVIDLETNTEINIIEGTSATAGSATKPTIDSAQGILLADVLLAEGQTTILNADIEEVRKQKIYLNNIAGQMDYVNVKDYGAVGDGVTDDTEAFKNAINSNKNVFIPVGIYNFNETLYIPSETKFIGSGIEKTILNFYGDNTAIKVGDKTDLKSNMNLFVKLSKFSLKNKNENNNSDGILIVSLRSVFNEIYVRDFNKSGFHLACASEHGSHYNNFYSCQSMYNLYNMELEGRLEYGGPNSNFFYGIKCGTADEGRNLWIHGSNKDRTPTNNNVFFGGTFEGRNIYYPIYIEEGKENSFIGCRFEMGNDNESQSFIKLDEVTNKNYFYNCAWYNVYKEDLGNNVFFPAISSEYNLPSLNLDGRFKINNNLLYTKRKNSEDIILKSYLEDKNYNDFEIDVKGDLYYLDNTTGTILNYFKKSDLYGGSFLVDGDFRIEKNKGGIILKSNNGNRFKLYVNDTGDLLTESI